MAETVPPVSEREAEVLAALAEHLTNAEIAQRLHISVRTVESHVSSLLRKLAMPDRRALAAYGADLASAGPPVDGGLLRGGPASLTSFVGRRDELAALTTALSESRLVNLVGPGGVGKTRLVVEAAALAAPGFPAGAWFIDLVPVRSGAVATALAAALNVAERPNASLEDALVEAMRSRRALLVLDNCEHVLAPVALLIERLLLACPELRIVATSRELLGIAGERVVPVAALDEADAVRLFIERAQSLDPGFASDLDGDDTALVDVCRRLDGIPLAIELASARCAVIGLDGVRAGLGDRLRLLTGARGNDNRHRSLRDVLDWSHDLLEPTEQVVLRRLSAFAGDFTAAEAVAVAGDGLDEPVVLDAIAQLTAKSLVVRRSGDGTSLYRLLETVRDYAGDHLGESGEGDAVHGRHLEWIAQASIDAEARLVGGDEWRFDALADDARCALEWAAGHTAQAPLAHALASSFAHLAYARHFLAESQAAYEQASTLTDDDRTGAADLRAAGFVAYARMRGDLAYEQHLAAGERAAVGGDDVAAAISWADAVSLAWRCPAEFPIPLSREVLFDLLDRARAIAPEGDQVVAAHLANATAWLSAAQPPGSDLGLAREAVAAARAVDDVPLLSAALDAETSALWDQGRVGEAGRLARQRLELLDRLVRHDPRSGGEVIDMFHMAADTAIGTGLLHDALDHALRMRKDELGATVPHASTRGTVMALTLLGRFAEAIAEADEMRRDWELAGRPSAGWMTPASIATELAHALMGDPAAAAEWAAVTDEVAGPWPVRSPKRSFQTFTRARLSLHEGRLDDGLAAIAAWDRDQPTPYLAYSTSLAVELAVVTGAGDAEQQLAAARAEIDENAWGHACLLRAEARLRSDPALLQASLDAFDEIDARFEWAITALLAGGELADRGRTTLTELGATLPTDL